MLHRLDFYLFSAGLGLLYCIAWAKNLFEVSTLIAAPLDKEKYLSLFNNIEVEISQLFEQTKQAFIESNEDEAVKSWESKKEITKRCDGIIEKLAKRHKTTISKTLATLIRISIKDEI